jgi:hypothetical protein
MLTRPAVLLRMEEAAVLAAAIYAYAHLHFSWVLFGVLFLAPDLFMVGYLVNARVGAAVYNSAHCLFVPIALLAFGYGEGRSGAMAVAIIWVGHIAFDRLLGYGLKYPTRFDDTHLQHVA